MERMCVDQLIGIFKGLLTPLIAIMASYIAWQQWQTNKQKLKLEKYDRRLRVYEQVREILSIILINADMSWDDILKKVVEERDKELKWLTEQFDPAKEKFRKYLDIGK